MRRFGLWLTALLVASGLAYAAVSQNFLAVPAEFWTAMKPAVKDGSAKAAPAAENLRGREPVAVESGRSRIISHSRDLKAVGTLNSDESVQIAPEIPGRVVEIAFSEGRSVGEGDVIVKLDDALARAELADAEARLTLAQANSERAKALSKNGHVTEKAFDEAKANLATASAAVDLARVRLDKHTIRAPFDGVVGMRQVSPGAFVTAGTAVVNLEKIDELKVDFSLPEIHLAEVKTDQTIELRVDALPGEIFTGEIYAINPMLDVNGRSLKIRARVSNASGVLRPGLFARIVVKGQTKSQVVVVPESAVIPRGGENFVYQIVDGKVVESKVELGDRSNAEVQILGGLGGDATIVTAGQQKIKDGTSVTVVETRGEAVPLQPKATIRRGS